jgi:hypothetical protein
MMPAAKLVCLRYFAMSNRVANLEMLGAMMNSLYRETVHVYSIEPHRVNCFIFHSVTELSPLEQRCSCLAIAAFLPVCRCVWEGSMRGIGPIGPLACTLKAGLSLA